MNHDGSGDLFPSLSFSRSLVRLLQQRRVLGLTDEVIVERTLAAPQHTVSLFLTVGCVLLPPFPRVYTQDHQRARQPCSMSQLWRGLINQSVVTSMRTAIPAHRMILDVERLNESVVFRGYTQYIGIPLNDPARKERTHQ